MAKLIYSTIASLDGYVEDLSGRFDWAAPDEEVHAFVNDLERPIGTYLYGRRMYETMVFWETAGLATDDPEVIRDFGRTRHPSGRRLVSVRARHSRSSNVQRTSALSERPVEPRRCHCAGGVDDGSCDRGDFMQLEPGVFSAPSPPRAADRLEQMGGVRFTAVSQLTRESRSVVTDRRHNNPS